MSFHKTETAKTESDLFGGQVLRMVGLRVPSSGQQHHSPVAGGAAGTPRARSAPAALAPSEDGGSEASRKSSAYRDIAEEANRRLPTFYRNKTSKGGEKKLGTLLGVLVPCLSSILGMLMFLRLPFIAGEAGIAHTLLILLLSVTTTTITTLSMSAIATNGKIAGGGSYYLISRSLGPQFGVAIGISFFLGTTASCAMSILGAVEALRSSITIREPSVFQTQLFGIGFLLVLFLVVFVGTQYVAKVGAANFTLVLIGTFSVFVGLFLLGSDSSQYEDGEEIGYYFKANWGSAYSTGNSFGAMLSLFFPSCSGIMSGANRSALLQDPSVSIPKGTLTAIAFTTTIYILWITFFASAIKGETLRQDKFIVPQVAWPLPEMVQMAIVCSSLGSALQALAGAPQLLNAISGDFKKEIPVFSFLAQSADNPIRCLLVTGTLVFALILFGDLDAVAPFTTMFLLLCYMTVNLACMLLSVLDQPSWRPGFKAYHWTTALSGVVMCFVLMLIDKWVVALIAMGFAFALYMYIGYKNVKRDWGDGVRGYKFAEAAKAVLELGQRSHVNNWRPQWLVLYHLSENQKRVESKDWRLLELARHFGGKTLIQIVGLQHMNVPMLEEYDTDKLSMVIDEWIQSTGVNALSKVVAVPEVNNAVSVVLQSVGIGVLSPNIVLLTWPRNWETSEEERLFFGSSLSACETYSKAAVVIIDPSSFPVVGGLSRQERKEKKKKEKKEKKEKQERRKKKKKAIKEKQKRLAKQTKENAKANSSADDIANNSKESKDGQQKIRRRKVKDIDETEEYKQDEEDSDYESSSESEQSDGGDLLREGSGLLHDIKMLWKAVMQAEEDLAMRGTIDIWWEREDGGLMIMLAILLQRHHLWKDCKIRLFTSAFPLENSLEIRRKLENYLRRIRVKASVTVVEFEDVNITPYVLQRSMDVEQRHELLKQLEVVKAGADGRTIQSKHKFKIREFSELARDRFKTLFQGQSTLLAQSKQPAAAARTDIAHLKESRATSNSASGGEMSKDNANRGTGTAASLQEQELEAKLRELIKKDEKSLDEAIAVRVVSNDEKEEVVGVIQGDGRLVTTDASEPKQESDTRNEEPYNTVTLDREIVGGPSMLACMFTAPEDAESGLPASPPEDKEKDKVADAAGVNGTSSKAEVASVETKEEEKKEESKADQTQASLESEMHLPRQLPSTAMRMATAVRYNEMMRKHSSSASIIITNLPSYSIYSSEIQFLSFTEVLSEGLPRMVLVKGTQKEVITTYI